MAQRPRRLALRWLIALYVSDTMAQEPAAGDPAGEPPAAGAPAAEAPGAEASAAAAQGAAPAEAPAAEVPAGETPAAEGAPAEAPAASAHAAEDGKNTPEATDVPRAEGDDTTAGDTVSTKKRFTTKSTKRTTIRELGTACALDGPDTNTRPREKHITEKIGKCTKPSVPTTEPPTTTTVKTSRTARPHPTKTQKRNAARETSSSSATKDEEKQSEGGNSLGLSVTSSSEESKDAKGKKNNKYIPKSTEETHGWRKWHRRCTPCPDDLGKKYKDPEINWICGAYQRARRSFKSPCSMFLRNCQDGTMFVQIAPHRCENESVFDEMPHGHNFMYDYEVLMDDESTKSESSESSEITEIETDEIYQHFE